MIQIRIPALLLAELFVFSHSLTLLISAVTVTHCPGKAFQTGAAKILDISAADAVELLLHEIQNFIVRDLVLRLVFKGVKDILKLFKRFRIAAAIDIRRISENIDQLIQNSGAEFHPLIFFQAVIAADHQLPGLFLGQAQAEALCFFVTCEQCAELLLFLFLPD